MPRCKLWAILAHWYNVYIEYFVLHITSLIKESVIMVLKHAKFALFYFAADQKSFFTFTWDPKWTQTGLKSQTALKCRFVYMAIYLSKQ